MSERVNTAGAAAARRGIQSVENGFRLLAALAAAGGPATLTSLSAHSGLSPSLTHRYLQSLLAAGMAVQDASSRYDLGPQAIRIGVAALSRLDGFASAETRLKRFVEDTGWSAAMSVWGGSGPVLVRWFPGRPAMPVQLALGSPVPLLQSATGQVFLGLLDEAEVAGPLAEASRQAANPPDLAAMRARVRRSLLVQANPSVLPGLRAVAAPIFDLQGGVQAVVAAIAASPVPIDRDAQVAQALRRACREATEAVGGRWPEPAPEPGPD